MGSRTPGAPPGCRALDLSAKRTSGHGVRYTKVQGLCGVLSILQKGDFIDCCVLGLAFSLVNIVWPLCHAVHLGLPRPCLYLPCLSGMRVPWAIQAASWVLSEEDWDGDGGGGRAGAGTEPARVAV